MTTNGHVDDAECPVCREMKPPRELVPGSVLGERTEQLVQRMHPSWSTNDIICTGCLERALETHVEDDLVSPEDMYREMYAHRTLGERVSDAVAAYVGSWAFLITQVVLLALWIAFNSLIILRYRFDPYPFIFLNLVLSWVAALQAPLILMSQNRQDARDRYRDEVEYRTNMDAEREIRALHEKLEQFTAAPHPLLAEIAQQQVQLMEQFMYLSAQQDQRRKRA